MTMVAVAFAPALRASRSSRFRALAEISDDSGANRTLPLLAPEAWSLPYDVVTVPLNEPDAR